MALGGDLTFQAIQDRRVDPEAVPVSCLVEKPPLKKANSP